MHIIRSSAIIAATLAPAFLSAQTTADRGARGHGEGSITFSAGATELSGDAARFQSETGQRKQGFGGLEELFLYQETSDTASFVLKARALGGNNDILFDFRWIELDKSFVSLGYRKFRTWYDGSGGYFPANGLWVSLYDEALHLDRGKLWFEVGLIRPDLPHLKLRYERRTREGRKGSTHLGDTNLTGGLGTRSVVPAFLQFDETRDVITVDLTHDLPDVRWAVGGRYEDSKINNSRNSRRRPSESQDRVLITRDGASSDIFSIHGYYAQKLRETVTFSAGAMITRLDANLEGTRIYGGDYDAVYDPLFPNRQSRDHGFIALTGDSQFRQSVANINVDFRPRKHWQIRPALKIEDARTESMADWLETEVTSQRVTLEVPMSSRSNKDFLEISESIEARYTGHRNRTYTLRAEWRQGEGGLDERMIDRQADHVELDHNTDYERRAAKYAFTTNWYAKPGLTFAAQYFYLLRRNEYKPVRDSQPAGYSAFIRTQESALNDFNVRMTWRPLPALSLTTRYDIQRSTIDSAFDGIASSRSARHSSQIVSQTVNVHPHPRLFVLAGINVTFDQVSTPAIDTGFVKHGDNNYINASLNAGYALGKVTDIYADYAYYKADNFIDNSALGLPYGGDERRDVASLTWVRRHSEVLTYTLKYTFGDYRDRATAGFNNYEAHTLYGRVQYGF